jgi:hypothetical protein
MLKSRWVAIAFFSLLVLAGSRPASAYYDSVGPVDMVRYCLAEFGQNFRPVQIAAGRDGWKCQNPVGDQRSMNLLLACLRQHNEDERHMKALWNGGQWICAYILSEQKVDLGLYCKQHFGSAYQAVLHGGTPYDWSCQRGGDANSRRPISVKTACKEQWNFNHVVKAIPGPGTNWTCLLRPA